MKTSALAAHLYARANFVTTNESSFLGSQSKQKSMRRENVKPFEPDLSFGMLILVRHFDFLVDRFLPLDFLQAFKTNSDALAYG